MPTQIAFAVGEALAVATILAVASSPFIMLWLCLSLRRDVARIAAALEDSLSFHKQPRDVVPSPPPLQANPSRQQMALSQFGR